MMDTKVMIPREYLGCSISRGTHRSQDLIPAFMDVLRAIDRKRAAKVRKEWIDVFRVLYRNPEGLDYGRKAYDAGELVSALFDILNEYAPDGYTFGSTDGDGSDFGFWYRIEDNSSLISFTVGSWAVCAIVNGDYSGIDDPEEIESVEDFIESENLGSMLFCECVETGFDRCEISGEMSDCCTLYYKANLED